MSDAVTPFHLDIPQAQLDDLSARLAMTRWPEAATADGWRQGVPLDRARALVDHWQHRYDWRRLERTLNALGQHRTVIDGCGIHFLHIRSREPAALPLIMTHGWPGSVVEFLKVIGPLTDPAAHGGDAADAFHLVLPSLPGYGFSDRPAEGGWTVQRIAAAWAVLMRRLGYDRYVAQGGDWGAAVTTALAADAPPGLAGIHLNMVSAAPTADDLTDMTPMEAAAVADMRRYRKELSGYSTQQATRPQTIGYSLLDSPVGLATWIFEKFHDWTDCDGDPCSILTLDEMLDDIMLYWLPGTGASSARLYHESFGRFGDERLTLPVACSVFPRELFRASRRWAAHRYTDIVYWNEPAKGGHFAAFEQPAAFVEEVRAGFRPMR